MKYGNITRDNVVFILLSFEGPDAYSMAGGLGVRVTNLSHALAEAGFPTHLFFVGDPRAKGQETRNMGRLTLHRWCQWISAYHPNGVYQGESDKVTDFNASIPPFVVEDVVKPSLQDDKLVIILAEEWHTAEAICRLSAQLQSQGLRDRVIIFWNANNTFGFDRIDWPKLANSTTITTVSRYMKHIMRERGVNALVIANGIPPELLGMVDDKVSAYFRQATKADIVFTKVARWDPSKGWHAALGATAQLKETNRKTVLLARGGIEPYGEEVMGAARSLGLSVRDLTCNGSSFAHYLKALETNHADILNMRFHCPQDFLRILYHASDAVLANSSHEPFGLVALETMAAGGIAFVGGTGEDYAVHLQNSIILETSDPKEIESYILYLNNHEELKKILRGAGRHTARQYTWDRVIKSLLEKIENQARIQGLSMIRKETSWLESAERLEPANTREPMLAGVT